MEKTLFNQALTEAEKSPDPKKKVGCVIARRNGTIISSGFNYIPECLVDGFYYIDIRSDLDIHAEEMAMVNARESIEGYTVAVTMAPCSKCSSKFIYLGISKIVTKRIQPKSRWYESCMLGKDMFLKAGVEYIEL